MFSKTFQIPEDMSLSHAGKDFSTETAQLKVVHGLAFLLSVAQQELSAAGNSGLQLGMPFIQQAAALSRQCMASAI